LYHSQVEAKRPHENVDALMPGDRRLYAMRIYQRATAQRSFATDADLNAPTGNFIGLNLGAVPETSMCGVQGS
jgi:hypothetical protein